MRWIGARSHSPRLAAARPPVLPTFSALTATPSASQPADQHVEADAVAADDDEVGEAPRAADQLHLDRRVRRHALHMLADGDEAVGLAEGRDGAGALGDRVGGKPAIARRAGTSDTIMNSVRPRSEATPSGSVAVDAPDLRRGRPASARMTGATNSWKVKIAEVGKPGSTIDRLAAR